MLTWLEVIFLTRIAGEKTPHVLALLLVLFTTGYTAYKIKELRLIRIGFLFTFLIASHETAFNSIWITSTSLAGYSSTWQAIIFANYANYGASLLSYLSLTVSGLLIFRKNLRLTPWFAPFLLLISAWFFLGLPVTGTLPDGISGIVNRSLAANVIESLFTGTFCLWFYKSFRRNAIKG